MGRSPRAPTVRPTLYFVSNRVPRNKRVDQLKVSALVPPPTLARHILVRVPDHRFTKLPVGEHFVHRPGEFLVTARFEKTHNGFVEVISIDTRIRHHDRHTERHELHDLCAVGLVAKGIGTLWYYPQIRIGHDAGYCTQAQGIEELHTLVQAELIGERHQLAFAASVAVDVKSGVRQLAPQGRK